MKTRILFAPIGSQAYMVKQAVEYGRGWKRAKCMTFAIEFCVGRSLAKVINITHFLTFAYWMLMMHVKCIHPIKAYLSRLKSLQQNYTKHLWRSNECAAGIYNSSNLLPSVLSCRGTRLQLPLNISSAYRHSNMQFVNWSYSGVLGVGNFDQMEFRPCRC